MTFLGFHRIPHQQNPNVKVVKFQFTDNIALSCEIVLKIVNLLKIVVKITLSISLVAISCING